MYFFGKKAINKGRQPEIDWLKAICILMMILLHAYDDCSSEPGGILYVFIDYASSFLGAAAFMICMGIGMRYSRRQDTKNYLLRGWELLTVGQLLNLVRNALPSLIAWWATGDNMFLAQSLLVLQSDILTFAGLAFLLMALMKHLKLSDLRILIIGFAMNVLAFLLYCIGIATDNYLLGQFFGLFIMTDQASFFPLCSYFVFVAFGYLVGGFYPRITDKRALSTRVLLICVPIVVIYYALRMSVPFPFFPEFNSTDAYVLNPATDAVATSLMTLIALAAFSKLCNRMGGKLPSFVGHVSSHVNQYYCVSNVLTFGMMTILLATTGVRMPGVFWPTAYGVFITAACYWILKMNDEHLHFSVVGLKPPKRTIVFAAIWIATILVVAYAYPRVVEFAVRSNGFLLP